MTDQANGDISPYRQYDDFPDFLFYNCIIHQQVLASEILDTNTIINIAFKIVNSIPGKSRQRRLFNIALEEVTPDIIIHTDVRWLSR
jgi:hypothetical protein